MRCRNRFLLGFPECATCIMCFAVVGEGIPCFLKALDLHPQCLHWGAAISDCPFWGPLGVRVQGSRGSQIEFRYESILCITSAFKELWRRKSPGEMERIYFPGWGMPQPPWQIPSPPHRWGLASPARTLQAPGSAPPAAHGHLMAASRTSFNGSLIIFSLNKGCSASSLLFYPARTPEKAATISAFPPRQAQIAQGDTVPAGKVNIICSYYLCCDSSQSPNRSPNAIALRLFTHTECGSPSERASSPAPSRVPRATSPWGASPQSTSLPQPLSSSRWSHKPPLHSPEMLLGQGGLGGLGFSPSAAGDG